MSMEIFQHEILFLPCLALVQVMLKGGMVKHSTNRPLTSMALKDGRSTNEIVKGKLEDYFLLGMEIAREIDTTRSSLTQEAQDLIVVYVFSRLIGRLHRRVTLPSIQE
jgi:hypothetical protein